MARGSSVLVVETDRAAREAAHARFASEGATVRTCSSFKGARETMAKWSGRKMRPDFIVSPISGRDGDGITFFLDAKRRFPDARSIISNADEKEHAAMAPRSQRQIAGPRSPGHAQACGDCVRAVLAEMSPS